MNIAIYGSGKFGCMLYEKLSKYENINVITFVETISTKSMVDGIKNVSLDDFVKIDLYKVDAIIIAISDGRQCENIVKLLGERNIIGNVYIAGTVLWHSQLSKNYFYKVNYEKPLAIMPYCETPIVEHCNLNCRYCSVLCNNKLEKGVVSTEVFEKDIKRMSELCQIVRLRIFGGEPLLHPELDVILDTARKYFSDTDIRLVTNGLLIPKLDSKILASINRNNVIVDVSMYKPTTLIKAKIECILNEHSILYMFSDVNEFFKWKTIDKGHDKYKSVTVCPSKSCRYLKNGMLSKCSAKYSMERIGNQFGVYFDIVENEDWFDIHNPDINMQEVLDKLNDAVNMCSYCTDKELEYVEWEGAKAEPELSDYVII